MPGPYIKMSSRKVILRRAAQFLTRGAVATAPRVKNCAARRKMTLRELILMYGPGIANTL